LTRLLILIFNSEFLLYRKLAVLRVTKEHRKNEFGELD